MVAIKRRCPLDASHAARTLSPLSSLAPRNTQTREPEPDADAGDDGGRITAAGRHWGCLAAGKETLEP